MEPKKGIDIQLKSTDPDVVRRWIITLCRATGLTPTQLAKEARLAVTTLTRFVNDKEGKQKNLGGNTLAKLRQAAAKLLAERGAKMPVVKASTDEWGFQTVEVIGQVLASEWRGAPEWGQAERYLMPVPVNAFYRDKSVVGWEVKGNDVEQLYPANSIVIAVPFDELGRLPNHGDRVVVCRTHRSTFECTIKEYRLDDEGKAWLWYRSDRPEFQTPIPYGKHGSKPRGVTITHLVIGSYRPEASSAH